MRAHVLSGLTRATAGVAVCGLALATLVAGGDSPASATPATSVVVNEVYGGGGNSGATYTNDFVELANRSDAAVSLDGWSVQYHSGGATGTWQVTPLSGSIAPGGFYLVGEAKGAGGTQALPATQATGNIPMSATAGTIALVHGTAALTCADSAACQSSSVDLVGFGTAAFNETAPAAGASNTASVQRSGKPDSDDNSADFGAGDPTPGAANAGSGGGGGGGGEPGPLRIHDIQGADWLSPHDSEHVTNVPGIVTAIRSAGSSKGYWIQDPAPDASPATSEGVFVYSSSPGVAVGDSVLVSGTVKDYYPLSSGDTVQKTSNLSVTEISGSTASVLSHGNALPAAEVITPDTVPGTYAPDLGGANIEATPIDPARSALDFWESREGMRVEVDDARVVGPSNSYGEQFVTTKPAQTTTYRGGTELLAENAVPSGRIEVVPADGSNPGVSVGDVLQGATAGPVDYSQFGGYTIAATQVGAVQHKNLPPVVATPQSRRQLAVATYNVENLAPGDSATKYTRLAQGVVTNLAKPDIVALEEVQDNTGATDDGVVAADQTLTKLTAAIVAAGGPKYDWREIDPVNDKDGGQPGGNIRVVFLFNPARVSFVDRGASSVDRSTTPTSVEKLKGKPALTLSPGRIDPANTAWDSSRKPLAGEFRFRNKPVFVVANHFASKLGDQNADGRYQHPAQSSAVQRAAQATEVHAFVQRILKVDKKADVVVLGDLNDYQFSPALAALKTGSTSGHDRPILTDLIGTLPKNQRYTYVYDGISEVLDHILVTPRTHGVQYQVVHVNAEYTNQTSDHDPQVVRLKP
ncbi:lamin tail domain-containing protein [Actinoallomurus purpureus]|uniref:lamin tail domain-containing protein n=1 Tax=Actinoallomurus purpureus TaxID=478114 RepID=UPI0020922B1A|nr:lamin tail domain-containing protein [Actinoallomurus purpureus]MCO6008304.1 lamin tail domain-containing protein [Actinoallomurus purpureus]